MSATPVARWRRLATPAGAVVGAVLAQAPIDAAYGLIAFGALGSAAYVVALALLGSIVANLLVCVAGGGRMVVGPRPAQSLLTAALVASLLTLPALQTAAGPPGPLLVLLLAGMGLAAAGLLQLLFAALRVGELVKFAPHPVRQGLASGIGLLLMLTGLPVALGLALGTPVRAVFTEALPAGAWLVALAAVAATVLAQRGPVPPILVGLVCATALHFGLQALQLSAEPGAARAATLALAAWPQAWVDGLPAALAQLQALAAQPEAVSALATRLAVFALTLAVLNTLDTLLVASVIDGQLRLERDGRRELLAQGGSNIATALLGAQASAPALARTLMLVSPLPALRQSVRWYAVALAALLLLAPQLLQLLPLAAIGGVLMVQGWQVVDPALWRTPLQLLRRPDGAAGWRAQRSQLLQGWTVLLAVVAVVLLWGVGQAVLAGALLSMALFVRANVKDVVGRVSRGDMRHSLKVREPEAMALLRQEGRRIAVLELQGAIFFGTADRLRARLGQLAPEVQTAVLDLRGVHDIDATGARIVLEAAADWAREGRTLVLTEWAPDDRRRLMLASLQPAGSPAPVFVLHTDEALEMAENRLLSGLAPAGNAYRRLGLGETLLGQGLDAAELALLESLMPLQEVPRGTVLFRAGDPGDAIYVSVEGDIGVRLPGSDRRVASFAPGVMLGELAVLERQTRSADAVAETDLALRRLSAADFERLGREHPALGAQLMRNISLHLAHRLRALTGELANWVGR